MPDKPSLPSYRELAKAFRDLRPGEFDKLPDRELFDILAKADPSLPSQYDLSDSTSDILFDIPSHFNKSFYAGFENLLSTINKTGSKIEDALSLPRIAIGGPGLISLTRERGRGVSEGLQQAAADAASSIVPRVSNHPVTQFAGNLGGIPPAIVKYGAASRLLGAPLGIAATDMLEKQDESLPDIAAAGARGAALGSIMKGLAPFAPQVRVPLTAATGYASGLASGDPNPEVSALTFGLMSLPGPKTGPGYRDIARNLRFIGHPVPPIRPTAPFDDPEAAPKPLRVEETEGRRALRPDDSTIVHIDPKKFIAQWEVDNKFLDQPFAWNEGRLKNLANLEAVDAYPRVWGSRGKVGVQDGRHRIAEAARRGQDSFPVVLDAGESLPASVLAKPPKPSPTATKQAPNIQFPDNPDFLRLQKRNAEEAEVRAAARGSSLSNFLSKVTNWKAGIVDPLLPVLDALDKVEAKPSPKEGLPRSKRLEYAYDRSLANRQITEKFLEDSDLGPMLRDLTRGMDSKQAKQAMTDLGYVSQAYQLKAVEIRKAGEREWERLSKSSPTAMALQKQLEDSIKSTGQPDPAIQSRIDSLIDASGRQTYAQNLAANKPGLIKGKSLADIEDRINVMGPVYRPYIERLNAFSNSLLDFAVEKGLVSKEVAARSRQLYPDYAPLNIIMEESPAFAKAANSPASISTQKSIRKLSGSDADAVIEDPLVSLIEKSRTVISEGLRNDAAKQFALIAGENRALVDFATPAEVEAGLDPKRSFSYMSEGKPVWMVADPIVAQAARSLDPYQASLGSQIMRGFAQLTRTTATGVNPVFAATNLAKDIATRTLTGKSLRSVDPRLIAEATTDVLAQSPEWHELRNAGGGFTEQVIYKGEPVRALDLIHVMSASNLATKTGRALAYSANHPVKTVGEILDWAGGKVGVTEEIGRVSAYKASLESNIASGYSIPDAKKLATIDSNNYYLPNYMRRGLWMKGVTSTVPYLNARIQGTKMHVQNIADHPGTVASRFAIAFAIPTVYMMYNNLADPERRQVWRDIDETQKDANLIFIPPNAKKGDDGYWNTLQVPVPDNIAPTLRLIQRSMETMYERNPALFLQQAEAAARGDKPEFKPLGIAEGTNLAVSGFSPVPLDPNQFMNAVLPSALKTGVEQAKQQFLYSGRPFVDDVLKTLPPEQQYNETTSGLIRAAAKPFNASPQRLQSRVESLLGGISFTRNALNAADTAAAATGIIPEDTIGGTSLLKSLAHRTTSRGGALARDERARAQEDNLPGAREMYNSLGKPSANALRAAKVTLQPLARAENEPDELYELRSRLRGKVLDTFILSTIADPAFESSTSKRELLTGARDKANRGLQSFLRNYGKLTNEERIVLLEQLAEKFQQ